MIHEIRVYSQWDDTVSAHVQRARRKLARPLIEIDAHAPVYLENTKGRLLPEKNILLDIYSISEHTISNNTRKYAVTTNFHSRKLPAKC